MHVSLELKPSDAPDSLNIRLSDGLCSTERAARAQKIIPDASSTWQDMQNHLIEYNYGLSVWLATTTATATAVDYDDYGDDDDGR